MSALWAEILKWVAKHEPGILSETPGLWRGETPEWKVSLNGHDSVIDGLPPFHVLLSHKTYLQLAVIGPDDGGILGGGMSEDEAIAHFAALEAKP